MYSNRLKEESRPESDFGARIVQPTSDRVVMAINLPRSLSSQLEQLALSDRTTIDRALEKVVAMGLSDCRSQESISK